MTGPGGWVRGRRELVRKDTEGEEGSEGSLIVALSDRQGRKGVEC